MDHLPAEILLMVLRSLVPGCNGSLLPDPPEAHFPRADPQHPRQPSWYCLKLQPLLSLCLVSRSLCRLAQPVMYREFILGYGDSSHCDPDLWNRRLTAFLQTVTLRRDLAMLVNRLFIHRCLSDPYGENSAPVRDVITLLLAALPNLEHCSLPAESPQDEVVRCANLRARGISHLPLNSLRITLNSNEPCLASLKNNLFDLGPSAGGILSLCPRLETLNLHMCGGLQSPAPDQFHSFPNLKSLRVTFSRFDERSLKALLLSCNGLRSFHYEATSLSRTLNDGTDHFLLLNAVKHLQRHSTTLRSLHIDLRARGCDLSGHDPKSVFTLQHFTSLRHLFLNMDEFHTRFWAGDPSETTLLTNLLPQTIETLHLAGQMTCELRRLEASLVHLSEAVSCGEFPNLKEILLDKTRKLDNHCQMMELFPPAGITFGYREFDLSRSIMGHLERSLPPNFWVDASEMLPDEEDPDL